MEKSGRTTTYPGCIPCVDYVLVRASISFLQTSAAVRTCSFGRAHGVHVQLFSKIVDKVQELGCRSLSRCLCGGSRPLVRLEGASHAPYRHPCVVDTWVLKQFQEAGLQSLLWMRGVDRIQSPPQGRRVIKNQRVYRR